MNTKSQKIIKYVAVIQLCLGSLAVLGCFLGVYLPYAGFIDSGKVLSVNPNYSEQTYKIMDEYFPEYKTRGDFWDRFDEYEIYDFRVGEIGLSFCVDKDYKIWGFRLEDRKEDTKRFSYFFADNTTAVFENTIVPPCNNGQAKFDNGFSSDEEEIENIIENQE